MYHEFKLQGLKVSENLAAIEEPVGIGRQREKELAKKARKTVKAKGATTKHNRS